MKNYEFSCIGFHGNVNLGFNFSFPDDVTEEEIQESFEEWKDKFLDEIIADIYFDYKEVERD